MRLYFWSSKILFGIIYIHPEELPLAFLLDLLMNSLSFSSSENIFILLSFLKNIFAGYRIQVWQFFPLSDLKTLFLSLLPSVVSAEKSTVFKFLFYIYYVSFCSIFLQNFSLSLVFSSTINCLGVIFFMFIQFGVHWVLECVNICLWSNFGKFSVIIYSKITAPISFSVPSGPLVTWLLDIFILPHRSWKLCS